MKDEYSEEEWLAFLNELELDKNQLDNLIHSQNKAENFFNGLQSNLSSELSSCLDIKLPSEYQIGNYKVTEEIGRGGMAQVYKAKRADALFDQEVAIKLLSPVLNTEKYEDYFSSERQLLASLNHPNIAKIFDGGVTQDQIPYFIMEYIDGVAIDEYCKEKKLAAHQIIKIVISVCHAVQHAHNNFILHRDIKPSNVLITSEGEIKLLDFGIGKILDDPNEKDVSFGGTLKYASPEQLNHEQLSTQSDIYQIGVLLYELLTGTSPFSGEDRSGIVDAIKKGDFKIPQEVTPSISTDINAIILKCMATKATNRYLSVTAIIDDLRNHLTHFPVSATPKSIGYRTTLYFKRNTLVVISFALIGVSLIAGTIVSLWQADEARKQRDIAVKNEEIAANTKDFLIDLFMSAHPSNSKGDTITVYQFLDIGYAKADTYVGSPEIKLEILTTIGSLYRSLGNFNKSKEALEKAFELAQDSAINVSVSYITALEQLALYQRDIGHSDSARLLLNTAHKIYKSIGFPERDSLYTTSLKSLAYIHKNLNYFDSATFLIQKAITLEEEIWPDFNNINLAESYYILGGIYKDQGQFEDAIKYTTKSLELCEALMGTYFPGTLANLTNIAGLYAASGDYETALQHNLRAKNVSLKLYGEQHNETATFMDNLGKTYSSLKNYDSAYYYHRRSLNIRLKINPNKENTRIMHSVNNIFTTFIKTRKADSSRKYLAIVLNMSESKNISPSVGAHGLSLAGEYYLRLSNLDSAKYYYQKALDGRLSFLAADSKGVLHLKKKIEHVDSLIHIQSISQ